MNGGLLFVVTVLGAPGSGFQPVGQRDGVTVYQRKADGIELSAEGDIAAPPSEVLRVLTDYAHHPRWVKSLAESQVIAQREGSLDVYQRLALPMIDDRDFTLHVNWGRDGERAWVRFAAVNERGPAPRRGVVRVNVHEGGWDLLPIDGGRATHAVYRFRIDLAGSFPSWMGRGAAARDVPALFQALRREVAPHH